MILYYSVRGAILVLARLFWALTIEGKEHVPETGSFVLAPVHRSNIDFGIVAGVTRRRMRYMAKESLWHNRLLGALVSALGAFPVNRGAADREALRRSLAVVERGEPLVLFPEGTRSSGPCLGRLHEGAAYVALRMGVPVVPVGVGGSEEVMPRGAKWFRRGRLAVVVGPPLFPDIPPTRQPSRRAVRELNERLQRDLQRAFEEARRQAGVWREGEASGSAVSERGRRDS